MFYKRTYVTLSNIKVPNVPSTLSCISCSQLDLYRCKLVKMAGPSLLRLPNTPRRHAALALNDRRLDGIEQLPADARGPCHQHSLVDDEAIGSVGKTHAAARAADAILEADVRGQPREEHPVRREDAPH